jgi:cathepsin A (carboxypeptidase C)
MIGPFQRSGQVRTSRYGVEILLTLYQNVYDVREKCKDSNLCYAELDWISEYLNKKEVQKELGAEVSSYDSCNFDINRNFLFQGDWMQPYHRLVPGILEELKVLIYAGDVCKSLSLMSIPMLTTFTG